MLYEAATWDPIGENAGFRETSLVGYTIIVAVVSIVDGLALYTESEGQTFF